MRKLAFLLIALLATFSSFSQIRKAKGVLIFTNNDSLSVEIHDEQLRVVQTRFKYMKLDSDKISTAFPEQVKLVKFADGRLFESVKTDSVSSFLLCLIQGYYNLYKKLDKEGSESYYLRHAQDLPIHLTETYSDQVIGGQLRRASNYEYAHQLIYAMADNVIITTAINKTKFVETELVEIVKVYNEFKGNKYPESATFNKKSMKIATGILIGDYPFITDYSAPGIGASFDFHRNRPYERFTLKTRILFSIQDYKKGDSYTMAMEVPIAFSYNYLERTRIKLDILGGITSFLIIDSYTIYGHRKTDTSFYPGPYLATGIDYKINKAALRFEISVFTLSFMLAYIF